MATAGPRIPTIGTNTEGSQAAANSPVMAWATYNRRYCTESTRSPFTRAAGGDIKVQPPDATIDNPPADLFTKAGWAEFASGFWLGGCGGAAFAWFLCSTAIATPLVKIAGGVWSVS